MAILLRILLILLPIILVFVWIRWRAKINAEGEVSESDVRSLRNMLIALVIAIIGVGVGLKMSDDSGPASGIYVPARVEDGKLIPGRIVPADEEDGKPSEEEPSKNEGTGGSGRN